MSLYVTIFFLLLILGFQKEQKLLFWPLVIGGIMLAALRGNMIGTDTEMYVNLYFAQDRGYISPHFELLFSLLYQLLHSLGAPIWVVQGACSALTLVPLAIAIKKNKVPPILGLFLYYGLFGYLYSFNAVRQMIGVSFVLLAYTYYPNKLKTLIFILIGMGFHSSAIVGAVVFITPYLSMKSIYAIPMLFASFGVGLVMNESILIPLLGGYDVYLLDPELSKTFGFRENTTYAVLMALLLNALFIWIYNTTTLKIKQSKWFKMYFICLIFNNLLFKLVLGTRVLLYFTMVQIFLYPILFKERSPKNNPDYMKIVIVFYATTIFFKILLNSLRWYVPYSTCL